ncbi:MAG TPA: GTPase ObgE [Candidatus Kapabacteria bacterium]|nr:GTPase ObgE [Candidatus Kapabacteria bacterium]
MQFVDEAHITVTAGSGGNGVISWRREKYVPKGGPAGGDGGKGGDVIVLADPQLSTLLDFRYNRHYKAENGHRGDRNNMKGRMGEDTLIRVPVGTVIRDEASEDILADLTAPFEKVTIAEGGNGGLGNARFRSSTNQSPRKKTDGKPGEEKSLALELKLLADVALVGFPNAGKSTLISRISAAKPKIADYPFTTLVPNLGIVQAPEEHRSFVVADIPGLIEGASEGKGLGHQFLRHIERSAVLLFLLDGSDETNPPAEAYKTLKHELGEYEPSLLKKPRLIAITKSDILSKKQTTDLAKLRFDRKKPLIISAVAGLEVDTLISELWVKVKDRS